MDVGITLMDELRQESCTGLLHWSRRILIHLAGFLRSMCWYNVIQPDQNFELIRIIYNDSIDVLGSNKTEL